MWYASNMTSPTPPVVFVDIDDTLVRSFGSTRMPMNMPIALVRDLKNAGARLYCWSSGGADYARTAAEEVGLADCFIAFLPKPQVLIDDMSIAAWKMIEIHPFQCASLKAEDVMRTARS